MAAGEDETQAIVFDLLVIALFAMQGSFVFAFINAAPFRIQRKIFPCFAVEPRTPAHPVDGLEARR